MPKGHFVRTEEHKKLLSEAKLGVKRPEGFGAKVSASKLAAQRKWTSEEREAHRAYMELNGNPFKGAKHSEEARDKMRAAKVGKVPSKLLKYGVTAEEYAAHRAVGDRWCFVQSHFVKAENFLAAGAKCCVDCRATHHRNILLHGKYGVEHEWYEKRMEEQGNGCAICGHDLAQKGRVHLHIDHCHQTEQLRGILCSKCNWAVERLDAVPDWAIKAAAYHLKYRDILQSGTAEFRRTDKRKYMKKSDPPPK